MLQDTLVRADTIDLEAALADASARYAAANPASARQHQAAAEVLPAGHTRSVLFHEPFPLTIASGKGAYVEDLDGHRYLNLIGDYAAGLFGHSHPGIRAAVERALDGGLSLGAVGRTEVELARVIRERIPSMEFVRFCNSGSEACMWATGLARAISGRGTLMVFNGAYHGGFLTFGGGVDGPLNAPIPTVKADYNDVEGARAVLRANVDRLAAVIVEPVLGSSGVIPAGPAFLSMLREETRAAGIILIFDEVMCSRMAPHAMQGAYGIAPDLTTLGKFWGGGFGFGAFGGARAVMQRLDSRQANALAQSGTFNNNAVTMAAGLAGARDIYTAEEAECFNARGDLLREELNALADRRDAEMQVTGLGSVMNLHWSRHPIRSASDVESATSPKRRLFHLAMLAAGYYVAQRGMISLLLPTTDDDLHGFVDAVDRFLCDYREVLGADA